MTSSSREINRAMQDAEDSLEVLARALKSSSEEEVEYVPHNVATNAYNAVSALNQIISSGKEDVKTLKGRGSVLNVMDQIGPKLDDPALQTMLGTMATQFVHVFRSLHQTLGHKDPKKVEGTLFGRLEK